VLGQDRTDKRHVLMKTDGETKESVSSICKASPFMLLAEFRCAVVTSKAAGVAKVA